LLPCRKAWVPFPAPQIYTCTEEKKSQIIQHQKLPLVLYLSLYLSIIYLSIYICIYTHIYINTHIYLCVCVYSYICIYVCVCIYIYTYICMYLYTFFVLKHKNIWTVMFRGFDFFFLIPSIFYDHFLNYIMSSCAVIFHVCGGLGIVFCWSWWPWWMLGSHAYQPDSASRHIHGQHFTWFRSPRGFSYTKWPTYPLPHSVLLAVCSQPVHLQVSVWVCPMSPEGGICSYFVTAGTSYLKLVSLCVFLCVCGFAGWGSHWLLCMYKICMWKEKH
jgi:hypothetical protein